MVNPMTYDQMIDMCHLFWNLVQSRPTLDIYLEVKGLEKDNHVSVVNRSGFLEFYSKQTGTMNDTDINSPRDCLNKIQNLVGIEGFTVINMEVHFNQYAPQ